jgi:hypothetical protein
MAWKEILTPDESLTERERELVRAYLRQQGLLEPVRIATPRGTDELIILLPPDVAAGINEDRVTSELQQLLSRKVWLATLSEAWKHTETL